MRYAVNPQLLRDKEYLREAVSRLSMPRMYYMYWSAEARREICRGACRRRRCPMLTFFVVDKEFQWEARVFVEITSDREAAETAVYATRTCYGLAADVHRRWRLILVLETSFVVFARQFMGLQSDFYLLLSCKRHDGA
jgi:hypothetical protein